MSAKTLAFALVILLSACSGAERICDPGATQECVCPGGASGAQSCAEDGVTWLACECVPARTASDPAATQARASAELERALGMATQRHPAGEPDIGMGLGELSAALEDALAASAMAEGATLCEQAFNGAAAMIEAMQKQMGDRGTMPDRTNFMNACNQLPTNAQQCMVPAYAMEHMQECQQILQTPEVQRMRELMRAGANMR